MAARIDQRAIVVLAVDLDQRLAHLAQELHADGDVVDEGAACGRRPTGDAAGSAALGLQAVVGEEAQHGMIREPARSSR